ncbi:MAG: 16S rRNA (uracil(1498)-N(3))-methyltransferase [Deltaproteobacteria bacterium]|nr:16S rRNA (uracil(1498)-N(3))-methyltransferase [Deltaproteobacteria bacterium]
MTTLRRAWVEPAVLEGAAGTLVLPAAAAHRLLRVLRLPDGELVELFDGTGRVARGTLQAPGQLVDVTVHAADDALPPLVVVQAVTRADKLELVVQKGTELGASSFVLFDAERGQVQLKDRADKRVERLVRVAADAARQAGRARVPAVAPPERLAAVAERVSAFPGLSVIGVIGAERALSEVLAADARVARGLMVVVGPEGGLTDAERERLRAAGATEVRLGAFVLRTETAALAALAAAQAALGYL